MCSSEVQMQRRLETEERHASEYEDRVDDRCREEDRLREETHPGYSKIIARKEELGRATERADTEAGYRLDELLKPEEQCRRAEECRREAQRKRSCSVSLSEYTSAHIRAAHCKPTLLLSKCAIHSMTILLRNSIAPALAHPFRAVESQDVARDLTRYRMPLVLA